jgi:type II restriction/modification system DNA methylase subunit YeeA
MRHKTLFLIFLFLLLLAGCNAAINMNGKVAGISSGRFVYQDGNLTSSYKTDIDLVWKACEKSVTELDAMDIQKERKISTGTIKAVIQDEKVVISVEYVDKDLTSVSVFVGVVGNNMASRLIHDKIISNLAKH